MATAAPRDGSADDDRRTTGHRSFFTNVAAIQVDLPGLRARLVGARRRLVERIADIQLVIAAVDAVAAEDGS